MAESSTVEKEVIKACMDTALHNTEYGCLFVIELDGRRNNYYTKVFESIRNERGMPLSILNESDKYIIKHLSIIDGATIIGKNGELKEFGVTLKNSSTFLGHGKRHAFALGTSKLSNIVCVLASEEDKHVRLFRDGACVADINSGEYTPSHIRQKIVDVLDTPLSKVLIASGIATSILTLNPIPAIITITGSSVIVSYGFDKLKKIFS